MVNECLCIETLQYPVLFKNGIEHIKVECADCGKFIKWKPKPVNLFTLWFGKYKGVPLQHVPYDYLVWLLNNNNNKKLKEKINEFLSQQDN